MGGVASAHERLALRKQPLLAALALALLVGLAACGGGGESGGGEDEAQIETAIVKSVTLNDASKCTEFMTQNFLEQVERREGKAALEECEDEAGNTENNPEKVTVSDIEIEGASATAHAAFVGSPLGGQTVVIALVKEGGQWKLDKLEGFVNLDVEAIARAFKEQLEEGGQLTQEQSACIIEALRGTPSAELEEWLLEGSSEGFVKLAEGCA
ncbi:MAG: hypothetical protein ACM3NV_09000 [Syntrophothermus sp.]